LNASRAFWPGCNAGVGAQARDHFLAAELGDREGVRTGGLDDVDQAIALGQRRALRSAPSGSVNASGRMPKTICRPA
jgi:hypothetical protein